MQHVTSLANDLLEQPANLSTASRYTVMNGFIYLALGVLFIVCQAWCKRFSWNGLLLGTREGSSES